MVILVKFIELLLRRECFVLAFEECGFGLYAPKSVVYLRGYPKLTFVCTSREFADYYRLPGLDPEYTNADMGKESGGDLQRGVDMGGWPSTMRFLFGVNFAF